MVASIFAFPVMLLVLVVGKWAGLVLLGAFSVFCWPVIVYLTARYLHLLDASDRGVGGHEGGPSAITEASVGGMRMRIGMSVAVAFFITMLFLSPPDVLSGLSIGAVAAVSCAVPLLILARFPFMKSASPSRQTLVAALVCVLVIVLLACLLFTQRVFHTRQKNATTTGLTRPAFVSATS
jgi:hypothetical protein